MTGAAGYGIHAYHNSCQQDISNNTVVHNQTGGILLSAGPESGDECDGSADYSTVNTKSGHPQWLRLQGKRCRQGGIPEGIVIYNSSSIPHRNVNNNCLAGIFSADRKNNNNTSGLVKNDNDDVTLGDYHLVPRSPLIHGGTAGNYVPSPGISPCIPALDFDGIPRQASAVDIGAHVESFRRFCSSVSCRLLHGVFRLCDSFAGLRI